jgi:hypothetical protein
MDEQGRYTRLKDGAPMLPSDLDRLTPTQRLILEQAYVMAQELKAAADSAPEGRVIDRCESFLLGNGRDFLRKVLESTLQGVRPISAAHNAVGLAGESPVVGIDCLPT